MIRQYEDKDLESLVTCWRVASEFAHPFLKKAFLDKEAQALRDSYIPATEIWVTEINGNVVGFIALMGNEIAALFLDPAYHGKGLGRAMADNAVAEKGKLSVDVFEENAVGRKFYDGYGFKKTGTYIFEPTGDRVHQMILVN